MAKGFPFDLAPRCYLPTGNCSRRVSHSTWLHGVSYPQETIREGFPVRLGSMVFLTDRKLFAYGFLSDLIPWCFIPIGNYSRMVSCPAWLHCVSYRQETVREGDFSTPLEMTGGRGHMVFITHRKLFAGRFLDSARNDKRAWLHGAPYPQETFHSPSYPCKLSSCRGGSISLYLD